MNNQLDKKYIRRQFQRINRESNNYSVDPQAIVHSHVAIATSKDAEDYLSGQNYGFMKKIIHFMFHHKEAIKKLPIIGYISVRAKNKMIKTSVNNISSKNMLQLDKIVGLPFEEFIIAAYNLLLSREPDSQGLLEYRRHITQGAGNEAIIYMLIKSDEFNNRMIIQNIRRYQKEYRRYQRSRKYHKVPVIGKIAMLNTLSCSIKLLSDQLEYSNKKINNLIENNKEYISRSSKNELEYLNGLSNRLDNIEKMLTNNVEAINLINEKANNLYCDVAGNIISQISNNVDKLIQNEGVKIFDYLSISDSKNNRFFNSINQQLTEYQSYNKTSLEIETSISQKIDRLPNFIALNNLKNKSMVTSLSGGVIVVQVGDFIMGIPSEEWGLAMFLSLNGHFEPGSEQVFCNLIKEDMTVIDVGANLGIYTLHALHAGCKVYSYEPTPSTFDLLNQNIKVNGYLESKKSFAYNYAVGEKCKTVLFSICQGVSGHNHISSSEEDSEYMIEVPVVSLDTQHKDEKIDFIKIDIEGAEYEAFLGMENIIKNNPQITILMEFAPEFIRRAGTDPFVFIKKIREFGLTIKKIDENTAQLSDIEDDEIVNVESVNLILEHQR